MEYKCPRCGDPVQRGTSTTAGVAGGAIGALLYSAFGSFQCKKCGPIARSEFPEDVRKHMMLGTIGILAIIFVLLVVLVVVLVALRPR